jgi:hypothetical protein
MARGDGRVKHWLTAHFRREEPPMTPHPFFDLAAQFARLFVVGMSIAAVAAVPFLLILALLL